MSRAPNPNSNRSIWSLDSPTAAGSVAQRLRLLYGEIDWPHQQGVLHVAAIDAPSGRVLIPGPHAPKSRADRFVLGVSRARADAIVTTGAILRSEPDLRHEPGATPGENDALLQWRRNELARQDAPSLIVLSGSGVFPLDHRAIVSARGGTILTTEEGARRLPPRVAALEVRVGDARATPIVEALRVARQAGGQLTIAIEAGPSATAPLYAANLDDSESKADAVRSAAVCDELLLSRFEGEVDPRALGPAFIDDATLERVFARSLSTARIQDESGDWRFERYRREATAGA